MLEGQCHDIAEDCATYYTMAADSKKVLDDKDCVKIIHKTKSVYITTLH